MKRIHQTSLVDSHRKMHERCWMSQFRFQPAEIEMPSLQYIMVRQEKMVMVLILGVIQNCMGNINGTEKKVPMYASLVVVLSTSQIGKVEFERVVKINFK